MSIPDHCISHHDAVNLDEGYASSSYTVCILFLFSVCVCVGAERGGGAGVTVVIVTSYFSPYNTRHESLWSIKYHNQN